MLVSLVIAGQIFTTTPDMISCQTIRAFVIMDMAAQIVNKVKYHNDDLKKMVVCKKGISFKL